MEQLLLVLAFIALRYSKCESNMQDCSQAWELMVRKQRLCKEPACYFQRAVFKGLMVFALQQQIPSLLNTSQTNVMPFINPS